MGRPVKECLRPLTTREEQELQRTVKAKSERVDAVRRAKALLWVTAGGTLSAAGQQAGMSREGVSKVVRRFNLRGLDVLETAAGRGRKVTYTSIQRAGILAHVQQQPDRQEDGTATWSLSTLQQALRSTDLPHIAKETIRQILHEAGYSYQRTRTWCRTGYALRKRKSGTVLVYDLETLEKTRLIELACSQAEADGVIQLNEDEAGPYQAIPEPHGSPKGIRSCTPMSTNAKARPNCSPSFVQPLVSCAPKVSCLLLMSSCIPGSSSSSRRCWPTSRRHTREQNCRLTKSALPAHAGRRGWAIYHTIPSLPYASCWCSITWLDTCPTSLSRWLFEHGVMPLYTPIGGSWLNMAESVQRIIVPRALAGQHPKNAQQVIDWLEQTVAGWNKNPTPFVWNGKRRRRRERARLRRLAGSGAAVRVRNPLANDEGFFESDQPFHDCNPLAS